MRRFLRVGLAIVEMVILVTIILAPRCANYQDVFVSGDVYFTDADCYARMTRVQLCARQPGLIVRHHDFENYPAGTNPHTTAPLDYLILGLSGLLRPLANNAIDVAGAVISPLLAIIGGCFLWWWGRRMQFRYRWVTLILFAISPMLVHGTELGRPDHQSLVIVLVILAICAEWTLQSGETLSLQERKAWTIASGAFWGFAFWISAYEPLILFVLFGITSFAFDRRAALWTRERRPFWISCALVVAVALLIERRVPTLSIFSSDPVMRNWARTIGELQPIRPLASIWLAWCGYALTFLPLLLVWYARWRPPNKASAARCLIVLLAATYCLTIWQARWGYFFVALVALTLPLWLSPIKSRTLVWIGFVLSLWPVLRFWDDKLWPNEMELSRRLQNRHESVQLRDLAVHLRSAEIRPFVAPWWLSPAVSYWSGQPALAGSSHESINGIADSARFFLTIEPQIAREILHKRRVEWVLAADSDQVARNSAEILGESVSEHALCFVIDHAPSQAPEFLIFSSQNGTYRLYRVGFGNNL